LSNEVNFKIYIICSPLSFSDVSNIAIVELLSQTLKDKKVMELFRGIQNWDEQDNDVLVSGPDTFITDAANGRTGAAYFWQRKINAACRKMMVINMQSAVEIA